MADPLAVLLSETERNVLSELAASRTEYKSYDDLKSALLQVLEGYVKELPAIFDPIDILVWGRRNGWVLLEDGTRFFVQVPDKA